MSGDFRGISMNFASFWGVAELRDFIEKTNWHYRRHSGVKKIFFG
jgi:hypothetical protein